MSQLDRPSLRYRLFIAACLVALGLTALHLGRRSLAADGPAADAKPAAATATDKAAEVINAANTESANKSDKKQPTAAPPIPSINWLEMIFKGGPLMIPIGLMSVLVVAFTIERGVGLRRKKVVPRKLINGLGQMAASPAGFDPRKAYRLCQQYPSSAANVVKAMLLKVGRPVDEVERTVSESIARETWKLGYNVRPISLAVTVTPLLGLLGTVLGMMIVFFRTANAPVGQDRAVVLADGIYLKLITTFFGLAVAVPALVIAHYFEGRIQALMREVEDLVHSILPQVEKYEGKLRPRQAFGVEAPPVVKAETPEPAIADSGQ
jgi:biopolymer transport protein ExbB